MTDGEIDRAAEIVRRTPIMRGRTVLPPSQRHGQRWRSLPVEGAGPVRRLDRAFALMLAAVGLMLAWAFIANPLARFVSITLPEFTSEAQESGS